MALMLHLRRTTIKPKPYPTHPFSTSNSGDGDPNPKSPFTAYFSDVKDRLKQKQQQPTTSSPLRRTQTTPFSLSNPKPSELESLQEIRKNLSEFRRRTSSAEPSSEPISFQEIYNRNVSEKPPEASRNSEGSSSWDAIRQSMQQLRSSGSTGAQMSLPALKNALNLSPSGSSSGTVIGGTGELPAAVFGREMRERKGSPDGAAAMTTEFVKMYGYEELGQKLRGLRKESKVFSVKELNDRLVRLREMEEEESLSSLKGDMFRELRDSLFKLHVSGEDNAKKTSSMQRFILGHLGKTPAFMMEAPKEHLVERYFHPDNMSSEEKLKIELAKVREEFKLSESDCGSARVQVAQLTTKIKHLSSVLHKKDKHSRKGLQAMVQRRKRLLKYLRSTDWDSYCFVISKLGLRDNADIKS